MAPGTHSGAKSSTSPSAMFDKEVIEELRRQFDAADKDGSGELDALEACQHFAQASSPDASPAEVKSLAESLRQQVDADRSGTISFDEYCFRFGRRYQDQLNRRRRAGAGGAANGNASPEAEQVRKQREALERERRELEREREELRKERERKESEEPSASQRTRSTSASSTNEPTTLFVGTRVTIGGLQAAPHLNGRMATVVRFDEAAGRYVVDIDEGGGQKSLRRDNLTPCRSSTANGSFGGESFASFKKRAVKAYRDASAGFQVWLAGYEWWQVLLGVLVVLLVVGSWWQQSNRYSAKRDPVGGSPSYAPAPPQRGGDFGAGRRAWDEQDRGGSGDRGGSRRWEEQDPYEDDYGSYRRSGSAGNRGAGRPYRERYDNRRDYDADAYDDYGGGYGGYGGGGGGGIFGEWSQTHTYAAIAGIGFLCWKGIIPVHQMSWFQIMMLWNMVQPLLFGGRRSYGGYGGGFRPGGFGFGRRRGFF